jgi:hypothetical protein
MGQDRQGYENMMGTNSEGGEILKEKIYYTCVLKMEE